MRRVRPRVPRQSDPPQLKENPMAGPVTIEVYDVPTATQCFSGG